MHGLHLVYNKKPHADKFNYSFISCGKTSRSVFDSIGANNLETLACLICTRLIQYRLAIH